MLSGNMPRGVLADWMQNLQEDHTVFPVFELSVPRVRGTVGSFRPLRTARFKMGVIPPLLYSVCYKKPKGQLTFNRYWNRLNFLAEAATESLNRMICKNTFIFVFSVLHWGLEIFLRSELCLRVSSFSFFSTWAYFKLISNQLFALSLYVAIDDSNI